MEDGVTGETKDLYVEDHDLLIDPMLQGVMEFPEHSGVTNGLIGFHKDFGTILTGFVRGYVRVTVELHAEQPSLDTEGWDDVLDISAVLARGQAFVAGCEEALTTNLAFDGPGTYRIRTHARGRADAKDAALPRRPRPSSAGPAPETYLIQVWKAPVGPEQIHTSSNHSTLPAADYTGPSTSPYQPAVDAPEIRAEGGGIVLVRTCFTAPQAWRSLLDVIDHGGEDGECIDVTPIDDSAYDGLTGDQLRTLIGRDEDDWPRHSVLLIADQHTLTSLDLPLLAVDNPPGEPAPSFRISRQRLESFVVNTDLGNTDFRDWSRDTDDDGIYRGNADGS
ncbi:hypothetical protein JK359_16865 [Streptomyces actinomycinicus]|uniref:DUF6924 domain-containing protein n=1 Tax=Streptomyces actinomycinicus TaxID=1695166 RepID=A0A937JLH4_9ACTN|nr:hypothetical protein [Streptomyces actinomycinicus]MBL1083619.1 hypothetical protein [Streptomyces actinomycinicus]